MNNKLTQYRAQTVEGGKIKEWCGFTYQPHPTEEWCNLDGVAVIEKTLHRMAGMIDRGPGFNYLDVWEGDEFNFPKNPEMQGHIFTVTQSGFMWILNSPTYYLRGIALEAIKMRDWKTAELVGNYYQREVYQ